jgi:hypothetical protein
MIKLYAAVNSDLDFEILQSSLLLIAGWADKWQLKFSVSKCKHFRIGNRPLDCRPYSIDGNSLEKVFECRDLGVIIDDKLRFHSHIRFIVAEQYKLLAKLLYRM